MFCPPGPLGGNILPPTAGKGCPALQLNKVPPLCLSEGLASDHWVRTPWPINPKTREAAPHFETKEEPVPLLGLWWECPEGLWVLWGIILQFDGAVQSQAGLGSYLWESENPTSSFRFLPHSLFPFVQNGSVPADIITFLLLAFAENNINIGRNKSLEEIHLKMWKYLLPPLLSNTAFKISGSDFSGENK